MDCKIIEKAFDVAGGDDVNSRPSTVVLYSVSYQPTTENKDEAFRFKKNHPEMMMIDDTPCGKKLIELGLDWSMLQCDEDREQAAKIWKVASKRFIDSASGDVHAFVKNADPRSVFRSEELPALLKNDKVSTINGMDKFDFAQSFDK